MDIPFFDRTRAARGRGGGRRRGTPRPAAEILEPRRLLAQVSAVASPVGDAAPAATSALLASTTSLRATPTAATFGQAVTFRAISVNDLSVADDAPGGTVTFSVDGVPGATVPLTIDTMAVEEAFSFADFTTSSLAAGAHVVTAHYDGDSSNSPSDAAPVTLVVGRAATATTLTASPDPGIAGRPVTYTATVAPASPQDGPTGAVTFVIGGIGYTAPVVPSAGGATGTATFTIATLGAGRHGAIAVYDGDANFAPSQSAESSEAIDPAPAPRVVEVLRFGYHAMPTSLAVVFSEPLDASGAQDPASYRIVGPRGQVIPVVAAALIPDGTVVLQPRGRLNLHDVYTLTVAGAVESAEGTPIGSEQVELITARNLARLPAHPAAPRRMQPPRHDRPRTGNRD